MPFTIADRDLFSTVVLISATLGIDRWLRLTRDVMMATDRRKGQRGCRSRGQSNESGKSGAAEKEGRMRARAEAEERGDKAVFWERR
jgi:hypothetical protein